MLGRVGSKHVPYSAPHARECLPLAGLTILLRRVLRMSNWKERHGVRGRLVSRAVETDDLRAWAATQRSRAPLEQSDSHNGLKQSPKSGKKSSAQDVDPMGPKIKAQLKVINTLNLELVDYAGKLKDPGRTRLYRGQRVVPSTVDNKLDDSKSPCSSRQCLPCAARP